ncbi:MAG: hypothetical protein IJ298_05670 [Ruminococcus sp.]|nr:hypothetical protein [Ruminococcus sp.]
MKNKKSAACLLVVLLVIFLSFSSSACTGNGDNFDVSGKENDESIYLNNITTVEDIENLVTNDNRLVINYYDAYIWTVYFAQDGSIEHMVYIYDFETEAKAQKMVKTRKEELECNKTMTIKCAKSIENYVVIDLVDTSFTNVTRSMLENNFSLLIVD